jgi:hypothetical protein
MSYKIKINNLFLSTNDLIVIVSTLFENDEVLYFDFARYVGKNPRRGMHDITLILPKSLTSKKRRKVQLPVTDNEIYDFVFSVIR